MLLKLLFITKQIFKHRSKKACALWVCFTLNKEYKEKTVMTVTKKTPTRGLDSMSLHLHINTFLKIISIKQLLSSQAHPHVETCLSCCGHLQTNSECLT